MPGDFERFMDHEVISTGLSNGLPMHREARPAREGRRILSCAHHKLRRTQSILGIAILGPCPRLNTISVRLNVITTTPP